MAFSFEIDWGFRGFNQDLALQAPQVAMAAVQVGPAKLLSRGSEGFLVLFAPPAQRVSLYQETAPVSLRLFAGPATTATSNCSAGYGAFRQFGANNS